jgi:hypothetical protein
MMNSSIIINSLCKQSLESFQLPEMVRLDSYIPAANHLRAI